MAIKFVYCQNHIIQHVPKLLAALATKTSAMTSRLYSLLAVLAFSLPCLSQPYGGTIFVDPDIIVASDSSTFVSATYTGQGLKTVFDRRVNSWIEINAYLFNVVWNDGLSTDAVINPEFASIDLAKVEAEKYGWHIGQLPKCLRTDVNEIWIHKGVELFGGGNYSILIHTGQSVLYENDGILAETLVHEASHTSLDAIHAESVGWIEAQNLDVEFISDYAKQYPVREDIAESFLMWLAVRYRQNRISSTDYDLITETIPNRLNYFDEIMCDMSPIHAENISSIIGPELEADNVLAYPNPTKDFILLEFKEAGSGHASIYNAGGEMLLSRKLTSNERLDISELPQGFYVLKVDINGKLFRRKFVKLE